MNDVTFEPDFTINEETKETSYDEIEISFPWSTKTVQKTAKGHKREYDTEVKTVKVPVNKGAEVKFCSKCNGRGHRGTLLNHKDNKIRYFGPKLCTCVTKHLYVADIDLENDEPQGKIKYAPDTVNVEQV